MSSLLHGSPFELHKEEQENETQHVYKIDWKIEPVNSILYTVKFCDF